MNFAYQIAIVGLVALNVIASVRVLRSEAYTTTQRTSQMVIIWLVPFIGAIMCSSFMSTDRSSPGDSSSIDPLYFPNDGGSPQNEVIDCGDTSGGDCGGGDGD
jgi:hypothetical protein